MMHALKAWLSACGWFPTFSICAHCKRGLDAEGNYLAGRFPTDGKNVSHGTCVACGALWLISGHVAPPADWVKRLAETVLKQRAEIETLRS